MLGQMTVNLSDLETLADSFQCCIAILEAKGLIEVDRHEDGGWEFFTKDETADSFYTEIERGLLESWRALSDIEIVRNLQRERSKA